MVGLVDPGVILSELMIPELEAGLLYPDGLCEFEPSRLDASAWELVVVV